jgi:hypothetical protein
MSGALLLGRPCDRDAVLSNDGRYRYVLNRRWDRSLPVMPWVLLNPSLADKKKDDNSVRRMAGFAMRERCGGICVLNLYAQRSHDPAALQTVLDVGLDPVGPDNDKWLTGLREGGTEVPVVVAWGAHQLAAARVPRVLELLDGLPLACLGRTASGAPKHPLRLHAGTAFIPYERLRGHQETEVTGEA